MKKIKNPMFFLIGLDKSTRVEYYYILPALCVKYDFGNYLCFITKYSLQDKLNYLKEFAKAQGCNAVFCLEVN